MSDEKGRRERKKRREETRRERKREGEINQTFEERGIDKLRERTYILLQLL